MKVDENVKNIKAFNLKAGMVELSYKTDSVSFELTIDGNYGFFNIEYLDEIRAVLDKLSEKLKEG